MATAPWIPEAQRLDSARAILRVDPGPAPDADTAAGILAAAGTLCMLDARSEARTLLAAMSPVPNGLLVRALDALALDALEAAALDALEAAAGLGLGNADEATATDRVLAALAMRDRIELVLLGAECVPGERANVPLEIETAVAFFEQTLRPELWRLIPLGESRGLPLARFSPRERARFWWHAQGADVPADGLDQLAAAALVLARFPEARAHLDAMVLAQARLDRAARPVAGTVVSLRAWAASRARRVSASQGANDVDRIAVGFAAGEAVIARHEGFTLSFAEPDELLVDLLADRAGTSVPMLASDDGHAVAGEEVTDCVDRFRFKLSGALESPRTFRLRVPLAAGVVEIDLPTRDA